MGTTASVPDLSTMRLDSFHEARRAALAFMSGNGGPMPSDTSTSGDSGNAPLPYIQPCFGFLGTCILPQRLSSAASWLRFHMCSPRTSLGGCFTPLVWARM